MSGIIFLAACGNAPATAEPVAEAEEPSDELVAGYQRLMDLHDEVMPLDAEIMRTERALDSTKVNAEQAAFAKTRLERASDDMMTWMYNNEPLDAMYDRLGAKTTGEHLRIREKEIRTIGDSMRTSIAYGQSLLK